MGRINRRPLIGVYSAPCSLGALLLSPKSSDKHIDHDWLNEFCEFLVGRVNQVSVTTLSRFECHNKAMCKVFVDSVFELAWTLN